MIRLGEVAAAALVDRAYAGGWRAVRLLPEDAAYALFDRIADRAWRRRGRGVRQLERNLARVVGAPAARDCAREAMRSYLRYWCDVFRLPDWDRERIVSTVRVEGADVAAAATAGGQGFVVALPHMGNWDHAGAWSCLELAPVTTVAERLRPEALYERFVAYRTAVGIEILPLTGGGDVFRTLLRRVREGRLVPLMADRDLTRAGVPVRLLGETTRMPPGPAALALATGRPLVPAVVRYDPRPGGITITFHPPVPVPAGARRSVAVAAMTQSVADVFGAAITAAPQDWHMLQPLWLADLPADRRARLEQPAAP